MRANKMDNDGIAFRERAYNSEKLLELAIQFIQSKKLYEEYMKWKETQRNVQDF
jgi:hypothetical protein